MIEQPQLLLTAQSPKPKHLSNPAKSYSCSGYALDLRAVNEGRLDTTNLTVRKRSTPVEPAGEYPERLKRPAHPSNRLVAQLNATWRVVDDPIQWILQRKKGNPRKGNFGWCGRSFCTTREALLRRIREHCGEVEPEALAACQTLPDWHPDWDRKNQRQNLDVPETDQALTEPYLETLLPADLSSAKDGDFLSRRTHSALP